MLDQLDASFRLEACRGTSRPARDRRRRRRRNEATTDELSATMPSPAASGATRSRIGSTTNAPSEPRRSDPLHARAAESQRSVQIADTRPAVLVRDAHEADMSAVTSIYARHVLHGLASFEEIPPSLDEMKARRANVLQLGLPYLVAELEGRIVGYSYATSYRARPAYRYTVEDSVYVEEASTDAVSALRCSPSSSRAASAVHGDRCLQSSVTAATRVRSRCIGDWDSRLRGTWLPSDSSWAAGSTASSCNVRSAWAIRTNLELTRGPARARQTLHRGQTCGHRRSIHNGCKSSNCAVWEDRRAGHPDRRPTLSPDEIT